VGLQLQGGGTKLRVLWSYNKVCIKGGCFQGSRPEALLVHSWRQGAVRPAALKLGADLQKPWNGYTKHCCCSPHLSAVWTWLLLCLGSKLMLV
jgi:hypothetical protein